MKKDLSKSYTWYSKDWGNNRTIFRLTLAQRGLYRELLDLAYAKNNLVKIDMELWADFYNSTLNEIEEIFEHLQSKGLVQKKGNNYTIPSVKKRLDAINFGSLGGRQRVENQYDSTDPSRPPSRGGSRGGSRPPSTQYKDKHKDKGKESIPTFEEFQEYSQLHKPNVSLNDLKLKYEAWKEAGWKAGKELRPIKNWKTTILNTLKYLDDEKTNERRFG